MRVGFSIGSNKGDRFFYIIKGLVELKDFLKNFNFSSIYLTKPWEIEGQRNFLNVFAIGETDFSPYKLLLKIQEIEKRYGREREFKYSPRTLDIDIIFYDNLILNEKNLKIPHPLMHKRSFVLLPMYEIEKEWVHPVFKKKIDFFIKEDFEKEVKKIVQREAIKI
jgi:2-amino-4-hydroxy-6-hydroxymethyldihydropteridine diphosphokinase